ncbi:MAG: thioredoxin [Chitinophagales bacterium]|jgi:thioredoxin 1|nr:thioredoxin [Chitinophagales bacterium]
MSIAANKENFNETINSTDKFVLVDFWAEWCAPCKALSPTLEELGEEMKEEVLVVKVDMQDGDNGDLAREFGVRSIPSVFLMKEGKILENVVGNSPKQTYIDLINKFKN